MNTASQQQVVFLTGATGFLGTQVARRLLQIKNTRVIALVHAAHRQEALDRLSRAWWDWPELAAELASNTSINEPSDSRIRVIAGDVSLPRLGLDETSYRQLASTITHVIHTAADLRIDAGIDELRKTNVQGTSNVLELARLAHQDHGLLRYAHVSTAYVAGGRSGNISESDLNGDFGFSNAYEQSKYEGECLVQTAKSELPVTVFRPGMIVGDSKSGDISTFNTFYFPLRLYLNEKLILLPIDRELRVNLVPVDYVADAILHLTFSPDAAGLNFHLTAPAESLPTAGELVEFVRAWARDHLDLRLPEPVFIKVPLPAARYSSERKIAARSGHKSRRSDLNSLLKLLPYFNDHRQFQRDNTDRLFGSYMLSWREFLPHLLGYAIDRGFMHRTERTVHEQLLARLAGKSRPVNYYDIIEGRIIHHSADEIRRAILAAAGALTALGIRSGDRVAIVGLNSTRYLTLDAAIGLVGAVSVPLYYTSPTAEIDHILNSSGARLLLVGAPKILHTLGELHSNLPVVSFCRESDAVDSDREVMSWDAFLDKGVGCTVPARAPAGFGDLATLRYTSGTTGAPKGVSFDHSQLRWMGQTMASLLPWKARNRDANYLSFLPMNHVVEGILATYSPYYLPAPVTIYFLEDLKQISSALKRVRPSIFFSVPRIYERIWEALEQNHIGRWYLTLKSSILKHTLSHLLRRQTLRNAGLDRCAQLLCGSAPCSTEMLNNFHALGIEIHNAYGLTEAPLVTLNRQDANRIGTVGTPLPQTQIQISDDGEVLVCGPQVMCGYFESHCAGKINQPFQNGWLHTGDLGSITPDGSLVLTGRKKELIKTSYGKYIQPAKVESLLRGIPGVVEAMLIGEQRPFCVALVWTQEKELTPEAERDIDWHIAQVNRSLSHPEQVKRWAVLADDLSIERGDLTANLKLKRNAISNRLQQVLDILYAGMNPPQAVFHIGTAERD